ncbi:MAG: hypothetical protein ACKOHG_20705 [Planctomycetia bacterium]
MSTQAEIKSIETLAFMKAALAAFGHETGQSLAEVELQAQRVVDWICVEQAAFWKTEVRRSADAVNQAMKDLTHCRTFKKVGDNTPACTEEKKALEKARRRLARAEQKAEAVRRWTPVVRQQFQETGVRLTRFREVIDVDCPKAMARLERMLVALDSYTHPAAPRGTTAAAATAGEASVARPVEEGPATTRSPGPAATGAGRAPDQDGSGT